MYKQSSVSKGHIHSTIITKYICKMKIIILFFLQKSLAGIFATSDGHPPKVGGTESDKKKIISI